LTDYPEREEGAVFELFFIFTYYLYRKGRRVQFLFIIHYSFVILHRTTISREGGGCSFELFFTVTLSQCQLYTFLNILEGARKEENAVLNNSSLLPTKGRRMQF
jgi:hypothetical protein